jgi:prepilin-type N-terminal cleavage/methylation domain-containing protein
MMWTQKAPGTGPAYSRGGFTIIEVLVVAAIIAILAGLAIPLYNGYLTATKKNAVHGLASVAAAAAHTYYLRTTGDPSAATLNLFYDHVYDTVTIVAPNAIAWRKAEPAICDTVAYR